MCACSDCKGFEYWLDHIIDTSGPHGNNKLLPGLLFARAEFLHLHAAAQTARDFVPGVQDLRVKVVN